MASARASGRSTTRFDFSFPFDPKKALLITAVVAIGGTIAFLATFWRPPKKEAAA